MLAVRNLTKRFGTHRAVDKLNLSVDAGKICGFLGPNGAGKTTTMRMIAGIVEPSAGEIYVNGLDVVTHPIETKRVVGYVPDRPYLYEKLTAFEYMEFIAGLYQLEPKSAHRDALEWLDRFGLTEVLHNEIESYSHGMKQRLVMSSVLLTQPRLMVVDEPMVGLDPNGARVLKNVLREQAQKYGMAILLSTHSLDVAQEVCDDIVMISKGRLCAQGSPDEIRALSSAPNGDLESVFIQLTAESSPASVDAPDLTNR